MEMQTQNWCANHRVNFPCDDWCPVCQEKLVEGLTNRCLTFLVPTLTETLNLSVIIQSAMPSSQLTATKTTLETVPTQDASIETEKMKNRPSAPIAESPNYKNSGLWAYANAMEIAGCIICQGEIKNWCHTRRRSSAPVPEHIKTAHHLIRKTLTNGWSWGILFRWGSLWVGGHYSYKEKRYCVNLMPCLTFWLTKPGGAIPYVA